MPLKKSASKKAFKANIAAEINAGKKPSQAAAIAYSVQRKAAGHKAGKPAHSKPMRRAAGRGR